MALQMSDTGDDHIGRYACKKAARCFEFRGLVIKDQPSARL
jgi:hypothetical protein